MQRVLPGAGTGCAQFAEQTIQRMPSTATVALPKVCAMTKNTKHGQAAKGLARHRKGVLKFHAKISITMGNVEMPTKTAVGVKHGAECETSC